MAVTDFRLENMPNRIKGKPNSPIPTKIQI